MIAIFCLALLSGCQGDFKKGYHKGRSVGFNEGKEFGFKQGKLEGYKIGKIDGYKLGHADGYKSGQDYGYDKGEADGYKSGENVGYIKGYGAGTLEYVWDRIIPSVGSAIVAVIFFACVYYLFKYYKSPVQNMIDKSVDSAEEIRQKNMAKLELHRKTHSIKKHAQINAHNRAVDLFKQTIQSVADEKIKTELEKLRQDAEKRAFEIQLQEMSKVVEQYHISIDETEQSKSLCARERAELYKDVRKTIKQIDV